MLHYVQQCKVNKLAHTRVQHVTTKDFNECIITYNTCPVHSKHSPVQLTP